MAGADYYSCDVCHGKTFYDCALDYQRTESGEFLPYGAGQMKVICCICIGTHEIVVREVRGTSNTEVHGHGTG